MAKPTVGAVMLSLAVAAGACGGSEDTRAFCERARSLDGRIAMDRDKPEPDGLEETAEALDELAHVAPDEIRPSITNAARLVRDVVDLVASIDLDDPSAVHDPQFLQRVRALEEREAALGPELGRVSDFLAEECGVRR